MNQLQSSGKNRRHPALKLGSVLAVSVLAAACSSPMMNRMRGNAGAAAEPAAVAQFANANGTPSGEAQLFSLPTGTEIVINVSGLTPGTHGFHIHTNGECASGLDAASGRTVAFGAAGGHFDPGTSKKHGQPGQALSHNHGGDLPNIVVDASGKGAVRYVNPNVTIAAGAQSVMGRTLVIHADPDDYTTDPAGNSGTRVLCGVIKPA